MTLPLATLKPRLLLVPVDFSPIAEHALDYACMLSRELGATVRMIHAFGAGLPELAVALSDDHIAAMRAEAMASLDQLARDRRTGVMFGPAIVAFGDPREEIRKAAEDITADLVVMGSHGRRGLKRYVLGSVAEEVLRRAPCPVLIVHLPKAS